MEAAITHQRDTHVDFLEVEFIFFKDQEGKPLLLNFINNVKLLLDAITRVRGELGRSS
jgi:hypothetical protein